MGTGLTAVGIASCVLALAAAIDVDEAHAQPAPVAAPVVAPAAAPAPAVDTRDDAAWQLYHQAFAALAKDDRAAARAAVAELRLHYPEHAATALAAQAIEVRASTASSARARREKRDQGSRAELALFQTFHGAAVGIELCVSLECESGEAVIGLALLGGAGGAGLALQTHPTPGERALYNSGTAWGAFNAAMLLVITEPDDASPYGFTLMLGQGAGLGLAAALAREHPTAGQVALANSGGQWSLALTGLTLVAVDAQLDSDQWATTLALAADAGLGVGAYLGWRAPQVSRAQTLVIDAAGIVGGVAGGAAGVMITGNADDRSTAGLAAAGAAVGLGAAAYFTRHWGDDDDGPPVHALLLPARGGGMLAAHLSW